MEVRVLSSNLQKIAIEELNEDPNRIQKALDCIKEWIQKQPHLCIRKDDQFIIAFLRGCKWNLQITKKKLDNFYSIRSSIPDFFQNRDPLSSDIQKVLNAGIVFPIPKLENHSGPVMLIYSVKNETPFRETLKLFFMSLDILMKEDDDFVVSGISLLTSDDNCTPSYYLQYTPTLLKNYVKCFQNIYPVRIKSAVALNTPTVFEIIFNTLIKPFISTKLQKRVKVLNCLQTNEFLSELPKNVLPEEYGGTNGTLKNAAEKWKKKVESYRDWFLEEVNYVSNPNLRIEDANQFEDGIGTDGNFRYLAID